MVFILCKKRIFLFIDAFVYLKPEIRVGYIPYSEILWIIAWPLDSVAGVCYYPVVVWGPSFFLFFLNDIPSCTRNRFRKNDPEGWGTIVTLIRTWESEEPLLTHRSGWRGALRFISPLWRTNSETKLYGVGYNRNALQVRTKAILREWEVNEGHSRWYRSEAFIYSSCVTACSGPAV